MSAVKHRSEELWVLMQVRHLGFGRNPMRRRVDRIEAGLLWSALVAALLMVVVGAATGMSLRNASDAAADRQRAVLHEVKAQTLESTDRQVPSAPGAALSLVRVGYVDQHGNAREGMTSVVIGTKAGVEVAIWLDQSGRIRSAPHSHAGSVAVGGTVGFLTVMGSWLLLWGVFRLACVPLNRRRAHAWAAEWYDVAPRWLRDQK